MRHHVVAALLATWSGVAGAAEPPRPLPPLSEAAAEWAKQIGKGAVATAEKRDGRWTFAIAGTPFAEDSAADGSVSVPQVAPVAPAPRVAPEKVLFEIGSISKVFTGLLLAHAVVEGKLFLDDTIAQRLPVKPRSPAVAGITLRQLATHSSCLPRLPANMTTAQDPDPYAPYTDGHLLEALLVQDLDAAPPCPASYSNFAFGVLGVVLERAYGKPWAALVQEKITGPLGMVDTAQVLSPAQEARFARPWSKEERVPPWTFQALAGAGALRSTLADLAIFADALMAGANGPLGPTWAVFAAEHAEMPGMGGHVGLGLVHARDWGEPAHLHGGGTGGFRSDLRVHPRPGTATIVLASNDQAAPEPWIAAWRGRAAQAPAGSREAIVLDEAALAPYEGVFVIDATARFTVLRSGRDLMVRLTGQPFFVIRPTARDEFVPDAMEARLVFGRDDAGTIQTLTLHQSGREIPARRTADPVPKIEFLGVAALGEYVGEYDFGAFAPNARIVVREISGVLLANLTGQPSYPVFATAKDRFEWDIVAAALVFERDAEGRIVATALHQMGNVMRAPRIVAEAPATPPKS